MVLAACGSSGAVPHIARAAFSEDEFGVKASPRVTNAKNPPKGGGRHLVGKPYVVRGVTYEPLESPLGYFASGSASWYGADFHGRRTANGEIFSATAISGASPVLPLPSYVRVTNLENGRSMVVRVNDRGPYLHGRVMDLSYRAAEILGYANRGVGTISVQYIGPAPLNGDDTRMLLASVDRPTRMEEQATRLASAEGSGRAGMWTATGLGEIEAARGPDAIGDVMGLFGYVDPLADETAIGSAQAAADAMGARASALADSAAVADVEERAIRLELGVFWDMRRAEEVALGFALLGAVGEESVRIGGANATRLRLTHLKPGVVRADVMARAEELGLEALVLYWSNNGRVEAARGVSRCERLATGCSDWSCWRCWRLSVQRAPRSSTPRHRTRC